MKRAALALTALAAAGALWWWPRMSNVAAFMALIRAAESGDDYQVIAGGDRFESFAEHPFVVDPQRRKPLGTTAAGAYQMVRGTWALAREALALTDFSPASQDAAAEFILKYKVPGRAIIKPEGTGIYELVAAGRFDQAIALLGPEWEAFAKMVRGTYHITLADARAFIVAQGGVYADAIA